MNNRVVTLEFPEGARVQLGVPADQPEQAIHELCEFFAHRQDVLVAKLGLMHILQADGRSQFTYTIGFQCKENYDLVKEQVLTMLSGCPQGRWPISVVPLTSQFFTHEAIEFYRKR